MQETIVLLDFPLYDNFLEYNDEQLDNFVEMFMSLQDYYGEYISINEDVHKQFHKQFGYGNNTKDQWNIFINNQNIVRFATSLQ